MRPQIPCLCAVNKIDSAMEVTKKSFSFPKKHDMPLYFVSAADGTNVVRLFRDSIRLAYGYRTGETQDFVDQILRELEVGKERIVCLPDWPPSSRNSSSFLYGNQIAPQVNS